MSLSSTNRRNDYTGNGSASVFAYSFRVVSQSDLEVRVKDSSGVVTTLALTTDYTVSSVGSSSGGNVTLVNSSQAWLTSGNLSTGYTLTIRRVVSVVQNTDIRNQGSFLPETHENAFDYLTMIALQHQDDIDRAVKIADTIPSSSFDPTLPSDIASHPGSAILVNSGGTGLVLGDQVFAYFNQGTQPTNPGSNVLAFWLDLTVGGMRIWLGDHWSGVFA